MTLVTAQMSISLHGFYAGPKVEHGPSLVRTAAPTG
jgi:hypothetical protein